MLPPRVAVIPAAGRGTRHLPVTHVVPKELLPVATRPLIDWAIEDCLAGGIRQLCVVLSPAKQLLREYLLWRWDLQPRATGASESYRSAKRDLQLDFIVQPEPRGLGDVALRCREWVGDQSFAWVMPDWCWTDGEPPIAQLRAAVEQLGTTDLPPPDVVAAVFELSAAETEGYGNCALYQGSPVSGGWLRIESLSPKRAGSIDLGSALSAWRGAGVCLLTPTFFEVAAEQRKTTHQGEFDDAPIFQELLHSRGAYYGIPVNGRHFDAGQPAGYARAHAAVGAGEGDAS